MTVRLILFFSVSFAISLVESCWDKPFREDYTDLCEKWWSIAGEGSNSHAKSCINLIIKRCPKVIDEIETTISRGYDEDHFYEESWTYMTTASRKALGQYKYYFEYKFKPLCWDDHGRVTDCDHWWNVAKHTRVQNKYKMRCIERIINHCPNKITFVGEADGGVVQKYLKSYKVKTITYKDEDDKTAFYNKYLPLSDS